MGVRPVSECAISFCQPRIGVCPFAMHSLVKPMCFFCGALFARHTATLVVQDEYFFDALLSMARSQKVSKKKKKKKKILRFFTPSLKKKKKKKKVLALIPLL